MLLYRGRRYAALTPAQRELKRDYLLEQRRQGYPPPIPTVRFIVDELGDMYDEIVEEAARNFGEDPVAAEQELLDQLEVVRADALKRIRAIPGAALYRAVVLPDHVDPTQLTSIGRYWTTERDAAYPFFGAEALSRADQTIWRYEARAAADALDQAGMVRANMRGALLGVFADETEVRLLQHAPIRVEAVERVTERGGAYVGTGDRFPIQEERRA